MTEEKNNTTDNDSTVKSTEVASQQSDKAGSKKKTKSLGKGMGVIVEEPYCPICAELGFREELHEVEGLVEVAANPQVKKGAPRVFDCAAGCRYGLEPYYNRRSDGSFCYMVLRSERNPDSVVNHYWFKPEFIKPPVEK